MAKTNWNRILEEVLKQKTRPMVKLVKIQVMNTQ